MDDSAGMWILELRGFLIDFGQLNLRRGLAYPTGAFLGLEMKQKFNLAFSFKGKKKKKLMKRN